MKAIPGPALLAACCLILSGAAPAAWAGADQDRRLQAQEPTERAAAVPDETAGTATPARGTAAPPTAAPPPYGPVLRPRAPAADAPADLPRKAPAEVRDETDDGARQINGSANGSANGAGAAAPPVSPSASPRPVRRPPARRPAWQVVEPLPAPPAVPRSNTSPVPPAPSGPQPVVPTSTILGGCQGGLCRDASGNTTTGSGAAGIGDGGRLCVRGAVTVQCF